MSDSPRRLALLVGINQYRQPNIGGLNGCVPDVMAFRDLITTKFQFAAEDVVMLLNEQATHAGIVDAFQTHLAAKAQAGDVVVFYYSGHGSQIPDAAAGSGFHQTIVPHDSRDPEGKVFDITMQELNGLLDQVRAKTTNITVICDSCYSGNLVRGRLQRVIPADTRPQTVPRTGAVGVTHETEIVFLSGCQPDQTSGEDSFGGSAHGAMSFFLQKQLRGNTDGLTWRALMDAVQGEVLLRFRPQLPQVKANTAHHLIFGGAGAAAAPYFVANFSEDLDLAIVEAGLIHGLSVGAQLDVYAPGTLVFTGAPVAQVVLTEVGGSESRGTTVGDQEFANGSRAVLRSLVTAPQPLRVFVEGAIAVAKNVQLQMVAQRVECDVALRAVDGGIRLETANGEELSVAGANEVDAQLASWAKWFALAKMTDPGMGGGVTVAIDVLVPNTDGSARPNGDEAAMKVRVKHSFVKARHISMVVLSGDGSVDEVHRDGEADAVLPGVEVEYLITMTLDNGRSSQREVFRAFATPAQVDLSGLQQGAIGAAAGSRGDEVDPQPGAWGTGVAEILVRA